MGSSSSTLLSRTAPALPSQVFFCQYLPDSKQTGSHLIFLKEVPCITMLYSLSSFVWGGSSSEQDGPLPPTTTLHRRDDSLDEEDWVVVGRVAQFPGTLAGNLSLPESNTPMLVSPAMSEFDATEEEIVESEEVAPILVTEEKAPAPSCMARLARGHQE